MLDTKAMITIASAAFGRDITPEVEMFYRTRAAIGASLDQDGQAFFIEKWRDLPVFLESEDGKFLINQLVGEWRKSLIDKATAAAAPAGSAAVGAEPVK